MKFKLLIFILISFSSLSVYSQKLIIPVGYVYNQKSFLQVGLDAQLTSDTYWIVGLSANQSFHQGNYIVIPEFHTSIAPFLEKDNLGILKPLMLEIATTRNYFNPSFGISAGNVFKMKMGYNFPYSNDLTELKGLTFGLIYSIGSLRDFRIM